MDIIGSQQRSQGRGRQSARRRKDGIRRGIKISRPIILVRDNNVHLYLKIKANSFHMRPKSNHQPSTNRKSTTSEQ